MEELQTEELEELVQELRGENGERESLPPEVEELLHILQSGGAAPERRDSAEQLGKVRMSSPRIVQALVAAYETDPYSMVSQAAAESLRAPVHQAVLQQHPDLMEATERALHQRPGADKQRPLSDTISMPLDEEDVDSFLSRVFHDPRWRWAPVYALFLIVTAALVFAVFNLWTLLAAGVVWFAGSVLGLVILQRKGHSVGGFVFGLLDLGDDSSGCLLALLALFALAGPAILLVALLVRPRGSAAGVSKQRALAKAAGRRKPVPVHGGDRPSDCSVCGAWNAPGSENCGECGSALDGADLGLKGTSERSATDRHAVRYISAKEAGYRTSDKPQGLSYQLGAALGALFVRIGRLRREPVDTVSSGEPEALDTQASRRPSPVQEENRPSDCTACGAWNAPGSENCGECGVALEGAGV